MLSEEILLILLTIVALCVTPIYIFFRQRMVRADNAHKAYSRIRVMKLVTYNLVAIILVDAFLLVFMNTLGARTGNLMRDYPLFFSSVLLLMGFTFYGMGIYITSIVLEYFTLPQLRFNKSFKTQFIATHLFHGPLSHILIYTSWFSIFFLFAMFDISTVSDGPVGHVPLILICGAIVGFFYGIAQLYNGTVVYQIIPALVAFFIIILTLNFFKGDLHYHPVAMFAVTCSGIYVMVLLAFIGDRMYYRHTKKHVIWDMSGGSLDGSR